ncbi:unannotated protein [freshwater metagenome]|uniref:Unannotated protein n=1 Tax=freshwater metagenome TaxID=449393 RepID=A0A6J7D647_9ZZZZ
MQLFVKTQVGMTWTLEVEPNAGIELLKEQLFDRYGTAPALQHLFYKGTELQDGRTLQDYNIQKEGTLHVIVGPSSYVPVTLTAWPTASRQPARAATWLVNIPTATTWWWSNSIDTRAGAAALTVQFSNSLSAPSESQPIPTVASYANGIASYSTTVIWKSKLQPRWVRIGSKVGKWTTWSAMLPG